MAYRFYYVLGLGLLLFFQSCKPKQQIVVHQYFLVKIDSFNYQGKTNFYVTTQVAKKPDSILQEQFNHSLDSIFTRIFFKKEL